MTIVETRVSGGCDEGLRDPVFMEFARWSGVVPVDRIVNFLGIMERKDFLGVAYEKELQAADPEKDVEAPYPAFVESYFEWLALLRSVVEYSQAVGNDGSLRPFTMIELGAGFGRWLANAAGALRTLKVDGQVQGQIPPPRLIVVEAEPQHFEWIETHFRDNRISFDPADLHWAACAARDGEVSFYSGASAHWWGQEIVRPEKHCVQQVEGQRIEQIRVPAISLTRLLHDVERVDLVDVDIQGAEADVISAAGDSLNRCVDRIIVATHNRAVEESLREFMGGELHWSCEMDFGCKQVNDTPVGAVDFEDGLQVWRNGRLG